MSYRYFLCLMMIFSMFSCNTYKREISHPGLQKKSDVYQLLYYASLAGSSHNSQPWKVETNGTDLILVFADMSRKLSVVDPEGRELYMSVGAFIENLNQAAIAFGYKTDIKIDSLAADDTSPVASIRLTKATTKKEDDVLSEIELRCTLRTPFDSLEIKKADLEFLVSTDSENIQHVAAASVKGQYVKQKMLEAYIQQSKNIEVREELARWIRFSNNDVKDKQDGLTTSGMGIKGVKGFIVSRFLHPEDSKKESFVQQGIEKTKFQVENCGGWILITQKDNTISSWINTGRLYERLNLKCRSLKLGFHPMNQLIEESDFELEANTELVEHGKIAFVARIGYVKEYPKPVSVRRPVESFTVFR